MMYYREIQGWYSRSDLEKWRCSGGPEMCRHGIREDGAWAGTGDLMAINNSSMGSFGSADLDLDKTRFRGNKENKEIVSKIHNTCSKFGCNLDL